MTVEMPPEDYILGSERMLFHAYVPQSLPFLLECIFLPL